MRTIIAIAFAAALSEIGTAQQSLRTAFSALADHVTEPLTNADARELKDCLDRPGNDLDAPRFLRECVDNKRFTESVRLLILWRLWRDPEKLPDTVSWFSDAFRNGRLDGRLWTATFWWIATARPESMQELMEEWGYNGGRGRKIDWSQLSAMLRLGVPLRLPEGVVLTKFQAMAWSAKESGRYDSLSVHDAIEEGDMSDMLGTIEWLVERDQPTEVARMCASLAEGREPLLDGLAHSLLMEYDYRGVGEIPRLEQCRDAFGFWREHQTVKMLRSHRLEWYDIAGASLGEVADIVTRASGVKVYVGAERAAMPQFASERIRPSCLDVLIDYSLTSLPPARHSGRGLVVNSMHVVIDERDRVVTYHEARYRAWKAARLERR